MASSTCDDSDSEFNSVDSCPVELGFAEECVSWKLRSKYFPSKIGGTPSWLNLKELPLTSHLLCVNCKKPMVFLLQVYAPFEDVESCFHRTIFVFMCKDPGCCKPDSVDNFLVLRCQLPRINESYNYNPYEEDEGDVEPSAEKYNKLCCVCGCLGPLRCSRCQMKYYCCDIHQKIDWSAGHKEECKNMTSGNNSKSKGSSRFLLPEYEIVTEEEVLDEKPEKSEREKMNEYKQYMESSKANSLMQEDAKSIELFESLSAQEDREFQKFRDKISSQSDQILRYKRNGKPLWVSKNHVPQSGDIAKCDCGANRQFEFQVMPQLLNYLKLDKLDHSVDWGTLAVYTCSQNCNVGASYHKEILWKQG